VAHLKKPVNTRRAFEKMGKGFVFVALQACSCVHQQKKKTRLLLGGAIGNWKYNEKKKPLTL